MNARAERRSVHRAHVLLSNHFEVHMIFTLQSPSPLAPSNTVTSLSRVWQHVVQVGVIAAETARVVVDVTILRWSWTWHFKGSLRCQRVEITATATWHAVIVGKVVDESRVADRNISPVRVQPIVRTQYGSDSTTGASGVAVAQYTAVKDADCT